MPDKKTTVLDTFLALVKTPSPSRRERDVAKVLARKIREIGYEPLEDDAGRTIGGDCGNIVVKVPANGGGPNLLLSAHIDTVEKVGDPPAEPVVEGNIVKRKGGGILGADDKAGVTALLELLTRVKSGKKKHGELLFVFTVAEEIECLGSAELDPALYENLDGGVILDYVHPYDVVIASPTKVSFKILVHGIAGHAAAPERKINAAHVLAQTVAQLPTGRLDDHTTANIGIMRSGSAINVIPDKGYAEYEIRSHRKDVLDFHVKRLVGIIEGIVRQNRIFAFAKESTGIDGETPVNAVLRSSVDVEVEVGYEGFYLPEDEPIVGLVKNAVAKAGLDPRLVVAQGGSDANIFNRRGLPSVVIGCGMHGAHGAGEYADLKEIAQTVDVLTRIVYGG